MELFLGVLKEDGALGGLGAADELLSSSLGSLKPSSSNREGPFRGALAFRTPKKKNRFRLFISWVSLKIGMSLLSKAGFF